MIALVNGTISGQGRIDWTGNGKVTSTGDFSTANMDLAAPFGPVTGLSGTIHFTDLLGLRPLQASCSTSRSINPGILVENGVIRYQLLPNQLVKIERGEWPFMGGRLILQETVLNFARPTAKRLTFEVVGLDAHAFVQSLGFKELDATGTFDGVLPMIFDENGGRIVGGRLDSREPGGSLAYVGVVNKAEPRHDGQHRLQRAARPALQVDDHPPRRRPRRRVRDSSHHRRSRAWAVHADATDHPQPARQDPAPAECDHHRPVPRAHRDCQVGRRSRAS